MATFSGKASKHVMISYELDAMDRMVRLRRQLQKEGYNVWMEVDKTGKLLTRLEQAVENADAVLICISKKYQESQQCETEAQYAYSQEKLIIPLIFEGDYTPTGWLKPLVTTRRNYRVDTDEMLDQCFPDLTRALREKGRMLHAVSEPRGDSQSGMPGELSDDVESPVHEKDDAPIETPTIHVEGDNNVVIQQGPGSCLNYNVQHTFDISVVVDIIDKVTETVMPEVTQQVLAQLTARYHEEKQALLSQNQMLWQICILFANCCGQLYSVRKGTIVFTVRFSLKIDFEIFWQNYRSGQLSKSLAECLLTEEVVRAAGCNLDVLLFIEESDYTNGLEALADGSSVNVTRNKALQCSVCLDRFQNPKTLPCLHSFCKRCLVGCALGSSKDITCPQCREKHLIPNGDVIQFPSNFHLKELVEEEALREQLTGGGSDFTCTCCDNQSQVVAKCHKCNHYLCKTGLNTHRRFADLRDHRVVVFEITTENQQEEAPAKTIEEQKTELELKANWWEIFSSMYNEEHSIDLFKYWMQEHGKDSNWQEIMADQYLAGLTVFEESGLLNEEMLAERQKQVANVFRQAGQYNKSLTLIEKTIDMEKKELGNRAEYMADLYYLAGDIYREILNCASSIKDWDPAMIRKQMEYARLSLKLRKTMDGEDNKYELGRVLRLLSGALGVWWESGGDDSVLSAADAWTEGMKYIDESIEIFKQLNAKGNAAKSIMNKAALGDRGSEEQEKLYREAIAMCEEAYGEYSVLSGDLHWNMCAGVYETRNEYHEAYNWLVKCRDIYVKIHGRHHPQTQVVYDYLEKRRYVKIRKELDAGK